MTPGLLVTTFFDWSKQKAFADNKLDLDEKLKFALGRVEKIVGKGENAGYYNLFKRLLSKSSLKVRIVW